MTYPHVNDEVKVPCETPSGTLFINVSKTFGKDLKSELTGQRVALEDCTRGYWTNQNLSQAHAYDCEWVMAHSGGYVVGVWKIDREFGFVPAVSEKKATWPEDFRHDHPSSICRLIPVDDATQKKYIGHRVHLGRAFNPLRSYFE